MRSEIREATGVFLESCDATGADYVDFGTLVIRKMLVH